MSLLDTYNLRYTSENMKNRVTAAVAQNSANVLNEDPATPNYDNRHAWAESAMANTEAIANDAMWAVVMNPTIAAAGENATDNDILFTVSAWMNDTIPPPAA